MDKFLPDPSKINSLKGDWRKLRILQWFPKYFFKTY